MRYWWVNQNQTFKQETEGGYLWSPKRKKPAEGKKVGARNRFYENMREVAPGDVVLSFRDTKIQAIGIIQSHGYSAPRPDEFGKTGEQWDTQGWRVEVQFKHLDSKIRPKDHIETLRPLLPEKYAPLQSNGDGLQAVYLTELPEDLASAVLQLIGAEAREIIASISVVDFLNSDLPENETARAADEAENQSIDQRTDISPTSKKTLVEARRGQGKFKSNVQTVEPACRLTGVTNPSHLIASHIKPWRNSDDQEKLDKFNGLLLTPTIDHLFDRGFISFSDDGQVLVSPVADTESLKRMGIDQNNIANTGTFTPEQQVYLAYHRAEIFKKIDD